MNSMTPLARGVFTLLGDTDPRETLSEAQLLAARQALSPDEHARLEEARKQAAFWLAHPGRPGAPEKLAASLRAFFELYGAAFARTETPLPLVALA